MNHLAKRWTSVFALMVLGITQQAWSAPTVKLNETEFRDRVYACWLGKNIGGTLGVPFEGKREPNNVSFYTNLKPGEPAANDDLDLQMLWLKAMEEHNGKVDCRILGEYWLKFVPVDWNEYGVGKRNMRQGILPPLSGEYDNAKWKPSNGAWIRSEIWACLAPGCPALAAKMAREDACVDHGAAEGVLAEIFTASIESAAFIEPDRDKLIAIGLSMIPEKSGLARAIRTVLEAKQAGKNWKAAREDVIKATEDTGWFQAPRNVAFTVLGWVYGENDFGKSLCIAVNCGDDTDCTGATLGSIFGILGGTKSIPQKWREPIGEKINVVAIAGYDHPKDLGVLTDKTVAMTKKVLVINNAPVTLTNEKTDLSQAGQLTLSDPAAAEALWNLSPFQIMWTEGDFTTVIDYVDGPEIQTGQHRVIPITLHNLSDKASSYIIKSRNIPENWTCIAPEGTVKVDAKDKTSINITIKVGTTTPGNAYKPELTFSNDTTTIIVPLGFISPLRLGKDDVALAEKGAQAIADSEYEPEKGCTVKAIDGILATSENFTNRWHSDINTPHPHWIEVKLPKPETIGRIEVFFADPMGYPVSFEGLAKLADKTELQQIFNCPENNDTRLFKTELTPITTDTFRLVIHKSANSAYPNAAQISEIALYPSASK